jgi:hypothetical protein
MFGLKSSLFSDVTGPSRHLVAATGFKPRAHGCFLRRIVRSHEPGWIPVRRHPLTHSLAERMFSV